MFALLCSVKLYKQETESANTGLNRQHYNVLGHNVIENKLCLKLGGSGLDVLGVIMYSAWPVRLSAFQVLLYECKVSNCSIHTLHLMKRGWTTLITSQHCIVVRVSGVWKSDGLM